MGTKIPQSSLQPGDVLLMQGTSFNSDLIRVFDQGKYSHAAIYDGRQVVEMLSAGTTVGNIDDSVKDTRFVDVYRFVGSNGKPLGSDGLDPQPVLAVIQHYEQEGQALRVRANHATGSLSRPDARRIPGCRAFQAMILQHLDSAAEKIAELIHAGKEPMICSELVYRCYHEAGSQYAIVIRGADVPLTVAATPVAGAMSVEEAAYQREATSFLLNYAVAKGHDVRSRSSALAPTPEAVVAAEAVADFVTPHDLEISPNLQLVGTLA